MPLRCVGLALAVVLVCAPARAQTTPSPAEVRATERASATRELDAATAVIFTGIAMLVAGAATYLTAFVLSALVRDSFEPTLGTAIGLLSIGLVLDIAGVIAWLDGQARIDRLAQDSVSLF